MRLIKNSLRAKSTAHCVSCRIESKEQKGRSYTSNRRNEIFPAGWCLQSDLFSYFQPLENCFPPLFFLYVLPTSMMLLAHPGHSPFCVSCYTIWRITVKLYNCCVSTISYLPHSYTYVCTHELTISRLNWHIRNMRELVNLRNNLRWIFPNDWTLFS